MDTFISLKVRCVDFSSI